MYFQLNVWFSSSKNCFPTFRSHLFSPKSSLRIPVGGKVPPACGRNWKNTHRRYDRLIYFNIKFSSLVKDSSYSRRVTLSSWRLKLLLAFSWHPIKNIARKTGHKRKCRCDDNVQFVLFISIILPAVFMPFIIDVLDEKYRLKLSPRSNTGVFERPSVQKKYI